MEWVLPEPPGGSGVNVGEGVMSNTTYKIVRFYKGDHPKEDVEGGLSLEDAQAHCNDSDSSSDTCTSKEGRERTRQYGDWFDGYEVEDD